MNAINHHSMPAVIKFLMPLFPGEEDYGAHRGGEEDERSPGPRVFQIQINGPLDTNILSSKC